MRIQSHLIFVGCVVASLALACQVHAQNIELGFSDPATESEESESEATESEETESEDSAIGPPNALPEFAPVGQIPVRVSPDGISLPSGDERKTSDEYPRIYNNEIRDKIIASVYKSDFSVLFPNGVPPNTPPVIPIPFRTVQKLPGGATQTRLATRGIAWNQKDHAEQDCIAIAIHFVEDHIARLNQQLTTSDDEDARETKLTILKNLYNLRFDIETTYEDKVVTKIEERARKLRQKVDARSAAAKEWVDAQVTLAEMRSKGIGVEFKSSGPVHIISPNPVEMSYGAPASAFDESPIGLPSTSRPTSLRFNAVKESPTPRFQAQ